MFVSLVSSFIEISYFSASALCVGQSHILVGCTEVCSRQLIYLENIIFSKKGVIRCFSSSSLGYVTSLPRPDLASIPDVTAMSYDETHSSLTVVYSDHSLVTWDVGVVTNVTMISSLNFHSSCVWSVDTFQGTIQFLVKFTKTLICSRRIGVWLLSCDEQQ